jgi:hypothetical protein
VGVQNLRLFLAPELRMAHIQLMAEFGLDAEYVGLLALTEYYYQKKKITKEIRDFYFQRYSVKVVRELEPKKLSFQEQQEKQKIDEQTRHWAGVLSQWDLHKDNLVWVERTVNYAQQFKDKIPDASKAIELGEVILRNRVLVLPSSKSLGDREVKKENE